MTEMSSTNFMAKFEKKYLEIKPLYECMVDEVLFTLEHNIAKKGIKVHNMMCRPEKIKSLKSACDKLQRKNLADFSQIDDIAGVRIICLYRTDLQKIGNVIYDCFNVVNADTSRTRTEAAFGYASDHYIVELSNDCKGARYDSIKDIKCEIQVRTLLMDAWASVSHHLAYKQEVDIPRELRTDFNSLAGLFYVADTHFELFRNGVESTRAVLLKSVQHDNFDVNQEINLETLSAYVKWKFPERKRVITSSIIISELKRYGYANIKQFDDKVNIVMPFLKQQEIETFENSKYANRIPADKSWVECWAPDGLIRHILDITDDKYFEDRRKDVPKEVSQRNEAQRKQMKLAK
jgi:putative GTP pyrophosphokinase